MTPNTAAAVLSRPVRFQIRSRTVVYTAIVIYAILGSCTAYRHEPWADESHSWLLARDAGLWQLWSTLLHYEGTPGLWQTLLHISIQLGLPYTGLNFISMAAGTGAAWLVMNCAPWPLFIRVALPFTYYLFYQYAVIARSYALLPALTFGCAILCLKAARRPGLFTLIACMLAAVSLDGFVLAAVIYGDSLRRTRREWPALNSYERKRILGAAAAFLIGAVLIAWSAWPARDNQFVTHLNVSPSHILKFSLAMIQYAFTGEWITTIAAIALSLTFLLRGGTLPLFLAATAALCAAHSLIYMHVWHFGGLLLAWLFCMWAAAARIRVIPVATASFALVIAFQGYWAIQSVRYDWTHPYSGSLAAAKFIKEHPDIANKGLYLTGFSTEAVKSYFSEAELGRMIRSHEPAYWDWSVRGHGKDPRPLLTTDRFGYLMAGYKLPAEQARWANIAKIGGYQISQHFEGGLFWRTSILEPESFDLYRRVSEPRAGDISSSVKIEDPSTAPQLILGFHDLESNAWRWTERIFSVALRRPAGADVRGARLSLQLFIPEAQIRDLGPMTLQADINGHSLGADELARPGDMTWLRDVPARNLTSPLTVVTFTFDKAKAPSGDDGRELGAIVKAVVIETK